MNEKDVKGSPPRRGGYSLGCDHEYCHRGDQFLGCLKQVYLPETQQQALIRTFDTGANRDTADGKIDPEGFLSSLVIRCYSEYMQEHQHLRDGSVRESDNWQKGMPQDVYVKSLWRHVLDVWSWHRNNKMPSGEYDIRNALCAVIFNASGLLDRLLKEANYGDTNPHQS